MEFGKLDDIRGIDWKLPAFDPHNSLKTLETEPHIFVGAPAWGAKQWIGKIYPEHTPADKFLHHYSRNFTSIELNTTHYRIPSPDQARDWLAQVPASFKFCPKFPKDISHSRFGITDKFLISAWTDFLVAMKDQLGTAFIQFHEKFSYEEKYFLFQFLENWPAEFRLSIEFRHPSWFQGQTILPALGDYLRRKEVGLVITDVAGRRDVLHSSLTAPWSMIRLIGNELDPSDELRLKLWAERLALWKESGLAETFLFLHQPEDKLTIEFAELAWDVLSSAGHSEVPKMQRIEPSDFFSLGL